MSYVASAPGLIISLLAQLLSIPAYRSIVSVTFHGILMILFRKSLARFGTAVAQSWLHQVSLMGSLELFHLYHHFIILHDAAAPAEKVGESRWKMITVVRMNAVNSVRHETLQAAHDGIRRYQWYHFFGILGCQAHWKRGKPRR